MGILTGNTFSCHDFYTRTYDHCLYYREEYKKAASKAYNRKMMEAFTGQGEFPKVRTFNKSEASTNSVFRDLEAAEMLWVFIVTLRFISN
mgnify:CR=1 FL=1